MIDINLTLLEHITHDIKAYVVGVDNFVIFFCFLKEEEWWVVLFDLAV